MPNVRQLLRKGLDMRKLVLFSCAVAAALSAAMAEPAAVLKNLTIINEPGRFGGWPANNGIWNWGDEIVVGFTWGYYKEKSGHPIDPDRPSVPRQARSLDGGETWTIETPNYLDSEGNEPKPTDPPGGIEFTHPDFAMMFRMEGSNEGFSRYYYSTDRCHTWNGPYALPTFDRKGIFARTDYIVDGKHEMMAFMTAAEDVGGEGWPFATRTTDGGKTWEFVGWIGEQPEPDGYSIMPSTLRINDTSLFSVIRRRGDLDGRRAWWMESFISPDNGANWYMVKEPWINNHGNPPHMIELQDGRWVLTYGFRAPKYGIRARISTDKGQTWGDEIILRDDGHGWDLGYPRTAQRADGNIVTTYYFNDASQKERYIAATIWNPGTGQGTE
jgi:hypothetical protein